MAARALVALLVRSIVLTQGGWSAPLPNPLYTLYTPCPCQTSRQLGFATCPLHCRLVGIMLSQPIVSEAVLRRSCHPQPVVV